VKAENQNSSARYSKTEQLIFSQRAGGRKRLTGEQLRRIADVKNLFWSLFG
jgi:hypothetical protein